VTLDEEFIKSMTGGDTVTARLCHKDNISFPPTWKLQMFTNHRPKIMGTDFGIWRRVHLWPYLEKFTDPADPADPQPGEKDKDILDKMRHEQPGILAKWVEGCLEWQRTGLKPPTCVVEATKEYREESDVIGQFLNECCEVHAGAEAAAGSLYKVYRMHAGENGLRPLSNVNFSKRLLQRTGIDRTDGAMRTYTGLRIQNEWFERLYEGNTKDEHNAQCEVIPF